MPQGLTAFAGFPFTVRGLVQFSGRISKEWTTINYPLELLRIPVNAAGSYGYFPQCGSWHCNQGALVGEYRVHCADGRPDTIPIVYGHIPVEWWSMDGGHLPTGAAVVWRGDDAASVYIVARINHRGFDGATAVENRRATGRETAMPWQPQLLSRVPTPAAKRPGPRSRCYAAAVTVSSASKTLPDSAEADWEAYGASILRCASATRLPGMTRISRCRGGRH